MTKGRNAIKQVLFLVYIFLAVPVYIFATQEVKTVLSDTSRDSNATLVMSMPEPIDEPPKKLAEEEKAQTAVQLGLGFKNYAFTQIEIEKDREYALRLFADDVDITPFKFFFMHESAYGYNATPSNNGVFYNYTHFSGTQLLPLLYSEQIYGFTDTGKPLTVNGSVTHFSNGLQNNSNYFYDTTTIDANASLDFTWIFSDYWHVKTGVSSSYTNRFFGTHSSIAIPSNILQKESNVVLSPYIEIGLLEVLPLLKVQYTGFWLTKEHTEYFQRLSFSYDGMKFFRLMQDSYLQNGSSILSIPRIDLFPILIGLSIEPVFSSTNSIVVPFSVAMSVSAWQSDVNKGYVGIEGGLTSEYTDASDVYLDTYFTEFVKNPSEQSDWYALLRWYFIIPIAENIGIVTKANVDYSKTAYGNGTLLPDYTTYNETTGLYELSIQNREIFNTDFLLGIKTHWLEATLALESQWLDQDILTPKHIITPALTLMTPEETFFATAETSFDVSNNTVPNIGIEMGAKTSAMTSVAIEMLDVINLFSNQDRILVGEYIHNSSKASIVVTIEL